MQYVESDPVCSLNASSQDHTVIEHEKLQMTCGVNYTGNWTPATHCHPTSNNSRSTTTRWTVTHSEHLLVTSALNSTSIRCTTDFSHSNRRKVHIPHLTFANNAPSYVHTWISSPINVLCTPILHCLQFYWRKYRDSSLQDHS